MEIFSIAYRNVKIINKRTLKAMKAGRDITTAVV